MSVELKRTYVPFSEWKEKSKQTEYTESTPMLADDGTLVFTGALMYGFPGDADSSFAAGIKITLTPNEDAPMGYVFTAVSVF